MPNTLLTKLQTKLLLILHKKLFLSKKNKGFQIIELTIVLAVIAMLTIGTFTSVKILDRAYERSIINQLQQIQKATYTFYMSYGQLPGDFSMASIKLPHTPECKHDAYSPENNVGQLNGNGDGRIQSSVEENAVYKTESYWFWCHLYLAEMGMPYYKPPATFDEMIVPGKHTMKTKKSAAYGVFYIGDITANSSEMIYIYSNIIMLHTPLSVTGRNTFENIDFAAGGVTARQAQAIMEKIDTPEFYEGNTIVMNASYKREAESTCITDLKQYNKTKQKICLLIQKINI